MSPLETLEWPAKIGLVADTHRSSRNSRALPIEMLRAFEKCDYIFHAGDICAPWVLQVLSNIAPTFAVRGNNEESPLDAQLPLEREFLVGKSRVGLLHGHMGGRTAKEAARIRFRDKVDAAVYGHSHRPEVAMCGRTLMANPGSPTQRRFAPQHTYAIMHVSDEINVELKVLS